MTKARAAELLDACFDKFPESDRRPLSKQELGEVGNAKDTYADKVRRRFGAVSALRILRMTNHAFLAEAASTGVQL